MKTRVAGVDEAGRGPLAGPVVAAAVVLDPLRAIAGLADSKQLSENRRTLLAQHIRDYAEDWSIGYADVEEIDRLNIHYATLLAMQRAVDTLHCAPDKVLVDGRFCPEVACPAESVIKGDQTVRAISAASIIAKDERDRLMTVLDREFPGYGFAQHKGYPTKAHINALRELGVSPVHRRSFAPVRHRLQVAQEPAPAAVHNAGGPLK